MKGPLLGWKLSLAETLSFGVTIAALTWWVSSTFQDKEEANKSFQSKIEFMEYKESVNSRLTKVEAEISLMRTTIENVGRDTSYIRGRLEPQSNK